MSGLNGTCRRGIEIGDRRWEMGESGARSKGQGARRPGLGGIRNLGY